MSKNLSNFPDGKVNLKLLYFSNNRKHELIHINLIPLKVNEMEFCKTCQDHTMSSIRISILICLSL